MLKSGPWKHNFPVFNWWPEISKSFTQTRVRHQSIDRSSFCSLYNRFVELNKFSIHFCHVFSALFFALFSFIYCLHFPLYFDSVLIIIRWQLLPLLFRSGKRIHAIIDYTISNSPIHSKVIFDIAHNYAHNYQYNYTKLHYILWKKQKHDINIFNRCVFQLKFFKYTLNL